MIQVLVLLIYTKDNSIGGICKRELESFSLVIIIYTGLRFIHTGLSFVDVYKEALHS